MPNLPLQAVNLHGDGCPWFPYRSEPGDHLRFSATPVLPDGAVGWATVPDDYPGHWVDLTLGNLASLMFLSGRTREQLDEDTIRFEVRRQASLCCCDLDRLIRVVAFQYGDLPEVSASHMTWCLQVAAEQIGV